MTPTVPIDACAGTPTNADGFSSKTALPAAEQGLLFEQLLWSALGLVEATGESQPSSPPVDSPAPDEQKPPTAEEMVQMALWLGYPVPVEHPLPSLVSVADDGHSAPSSSLTQVALLQQATADFPVPAQATAPSGLTEGQQVSGRQPLPQAVPVAEGTEALLPSQPADHPTAVASPSRGLFWLPYENMAEPSKPPAMEEPTALEMPRLLEGVTGKSEAPVEISPTTAGTPPPAAAPAQASSTSQFQNSNTLGQPNVPLASPAGARPQTKRNIAQSEDNALSPAQPEVSAAHLAPNAQMAAVTGQTGEPATSPEVSPAEVVRQVVLQLEEVTRGQGTNRVTIQLEPDHLGTLHVTLSVVDDTVHARIIAASHTVRQILESHSSLLQQALQERGLQLGALQVSVQGEGRHFPLYQSHTVAPLVGSGSLLEGTAPTTSERSIWYATLGSVNLLV
ncbi:MAG: flagellar hook-length control protein FliK [Armatimonadota bacterium]|nr:flagellar hook-length control protein FliK [Armatimonadota bacterium]